MTTTIGRNKTYVQTAVHWPAPVLVMSHRADAHWSGFPSRILVPWDALLTDGATPVSQHVRALEYVRIARHSGWTESDE